MALTKRQKEQKQARKTSAADWAKQQTQGFEPTCIRLPKGVQLYKPEVGSPEIDILRYRVGWGNKRADEGELHFELEYSAHRIPTPNGNKMYLCLWECFGQPCPACEWRRDHGGSADQELSKQLRPTTRHLWNVICPNEKPIKAKVFDTNHYNKGQGFGEMVADALTTKAKYGDFAEWQGGYRLTLTVKELTFPGGKYNGVVRIDFEKREEDYDDDIEDKLVCLEDCLYPAMPKELRDKPLKEFDKKDWKACYNELKRLLDFGETGSNGEPQEVESVRRSSADDEGEEADEGAAAAKGIEIGSEVEHPEYGLCTVIKITGDGQFLRLEDEDGEIYSSIDPEEVELAEDKPKAAAKEGGKKKPESEPEGEDEDTEELEDDDEEEEEPPSRRVKKPARGRSSRKGHDEEE